METYSSQADFFRSQLIAIPLKPAQPNFTLTTILLLKHETEGSSCLGLKKGEPRSKFVRVGKLADSCGNEEHRAQIAQQLGNMDMLEYPFREVPAQSVIVGCWEVTKEASLGLVVPDVGIFGSWFKSTCTLNYKAFDVVTHSLVDAYLKDIITKKKWVPDDSSLRDFYVVNEVLLSTHINIKLKRATKGGAGVKPQDSPAHAGLECSVNADGSLDIWGAMQGEVRKPFPFAYRAVHIKYKPDTWELENMLELGEVRGELPVSAFVKDDDEYHIGGFFLDTEDDDEVGIQLVPVIWDELSPV